MNEKLKALRDSIASIATNIGNVIPDQQRPPAARKKNPGRFDEFLANCKTWLNKTVRYDQRLTTDLITAFLYRRLNDYGFPIALPCFYYQGSEMDMAGIAKDHLVEFELKCSRADYVRDLRKIVNMGVRQLNKHAMLADGKLVANKFFFVCPAGVIDKEHLPAHAGLITVRMGKDGFPIFDLVVEAPLLHSNKLQPGFYKTLAERIHKKYDQLLLRTRFNKKHLYDYTLHSKYHSTNARADGAVRQIPVQDPDRPTATGREEAPPSD